MVQRLVMAAALVALAGCTGGEPDAGRDVTDSGAALDNIGQPPGAESIPPEMTGRTSEPLPRESLPVAPPRADSADDPTRYKRPERRPVREVPPLVRPDSVPR